jgi:hypothetical protein
LHWAFVRQQLNKKEQIAPTILLSIVVGRVRLAEKKLKRDTLIAFGIRPAAIK